MVHVVTKEKEGENQNTGNINLIRVAVNTTIIATYSHQKIYLKNCALTI